MVRRKQGRVSDASPGMLGSANTKMRPEPGALHEREQRQEKVLLGKPEQRRRSLSDAVQKMLPGHFLDWPPSFVDFTYVEGVTLRERLAELRRLANEGEKHARSDASSTRS